MPKASAAAALGFLKMRSRAVKWIGLVIASVALVAFGGLATPIWLGPRPAGAAGEGWHPGIVRVPLDAQLTERAVYPPGIAVGNFDGAYALATMYKSGVFAGNKVALWGSEAGALKAGNCPLDEFVYILEGDLVTVDERRRPARISSWRCFHHSERLGRALGYEDPIQENHREFLRIRAHARSASLG